MMNRKLLLIGLAMMACLIGTSNAMPILDSQNFDWKYEMDVQPNNQDLNNSGSDDFWDGGALTVSNGVAIGTGDDTYFRTDYGGSIWRDEITGAAFTIEFSVQILETGEEGTAGTMGMYARNLETGGGPYLNVARSGQTLINTQATLDLGSQDNTDGQHVFRVAREGDGSVWVYRDGVMLNPNGQPIVGDLSVFNNDIFQIGDIWSTGHSGDYEIDYVRLTDGAYAPVPEPATMLLLGLGGMLTLRKKK
ncbi:hypothetical protein STSP2_01339 [Anaerohalosphaera lusitana]|uniref:Ice-binding protein C-terminal domain-containing protein n=1 Tax=Anaerohalosphaera lusitana TaxID=1936003 RepID=A0A1U9NKC2_9BACT|nr:PEP-CTERM sorting domain-containing protein [Anaerohalosphaera lusitana]AQT68184.1 hypothetical protein STSP2_01339 [Anaerohalosphaera lusitana]